MVDYASVLVIALCEIADFLIQVVANSVSMVVELLH